MNLNGTISNTFVRNTVFNGPVAVTMTIDRPASNKVQVQLSNGWQTDIVGADYTALCANWKSDADLLAFIANKNGLSVG